MKKQVVLAALVCGLLGSSYAGSSYVDETEEDDYWKAAPYDNGELSSFRSSAPAQMPDQNRVYNQSRRLDVPSRFSSSNYADPKDIAVDDSDNYVINDQTGRRVSLNEPGDQRPAMERNMGFAQAAQPTARRYPQSAEGPRPTYQQSSQNSPFDMSRDFSNGYTDGETPRYALQRQEPKQLPPVQEEEPQQMQPDRVFSQSRVEPSQMEARQQQFASPTSTRRPRVRKNVGSMPAQRVQRTAWYKQPFQSVSRFFSGLFRR